MIKDLFDQLKSKLDSSNDPSQQNETSADGSPVGRLTSEKIKAIVAELADAAPIFEQAGFIMEQLEIELGLIPKITPQFTQIRPITAEEEAEVMAQLNSRRLLQFVLQSLFKSSRMKALMDSTDLDLHAIEIDVSVPPSVRTIFKRNPNSRRSSNASELQGESQQTQPETSVSQE